MRLKGRAARLGGPCRLPLRPGRRGGCSGPRGPLGVVAREPHGAFGGAAGEVRHRPLLGRCRRDWPRTTTCWPAGCGELACRLWRADSGRPPKPHVDGPSQGLSRGLASCRAPFPCVRRFWSNRLASGREGRMQPRRARWADKPGSVVDDHLSTAGVATRLYRATRARCGPHHGAPICVFSGWGLPSRRVATTLVVSYTTVSAFPFARAERPRRQLESSFLRRFPSGFPARPLAGIMPCGARTFLMTRTQGARPAVVWPTSRAVL